MGPMVDYSIVRAPFARGVCTFSPPSGVIMIDVYVGSNNGAVGLCRHCVVQVSRQIACYYGVFDRQIVEGNYFAKLTAG